MDDDYHKLDPGSTVKAIADKPGIRKTLLGGPDKKGKSDGYGLERGTAVELNRGGK